MAHGRSIGLGLLMGVLARIILLRSDYRQYPTYPHGYASHLFLGIIAALVGAVSVPALIEREWTAVTFFVVVAQQFREIRSMERDSLKALEETQLVARGADYIESIARVFEARYYIVILVAASAAYGTERGGVLLGIVLGVLAFAGSASVIKQEPLWMSVEVKPAKLSFKGAGLYVDDSWGLRRMWTLLNTRPWLPGTFPRDGSGYSWCLRSGILSSSFKSLGALRCWNLQEAGQCTAGQCKGKS